MATPQQLQQLGAIHKSQEMKKKQMQAKKTAMRTLADNVTQTSIARQTGRDIKINGVRYIESEELFFSTTLVSAAGFPASMTITFFKNPLGNIGTPTFNLPEGPTRCNLTDGAPMSGEIHKLLGVGIESRPCGMATDNAYLDRVSRQPFMFKVTIGNDNKDYITERPLSTALITGNLLSPNLKINSPSGMHYFRDDILYYQGNPINFQRDGDYSPKYGQQYPIRISLRNGGDLWLPADTGQPSVDTLWRAYARVLVKKPLLSN